MIRLTAADLRALAQTLDSLDESERETGVQIVGHSRNAITITTTWCPEVITINRIQADDTEDGTYVVEIDEG